jgi:hypothetical protein
VVYNHGRADALTLNDLLSQPGSPGAITPRRGFFRQLGCKVIVAFKVEVVDGDLIVTCPGFKAVYYKAKGQPRLTLEHRTKTDDHELLAKAFQAAVAKARELGWIV